SHVRLFLLGGEQIEEQRSQTGLAQPSGDLLVARAVPAAPAPVREEHNPLRSGWNEQLAMECELAGRDCSLLTLFVLCAIEIRFHWFREPEAQSHYAPNHSISPPSGEFKREQPARSGGGFWSRTGFRLITSAPTAFSVCSR